MKFALLLAIVSLMFATPAIAQQQGNAARGATLYQQRCGACHSMDANRVGPMHRGVYGRRSGAVPGFHYSPALQRLGVTWNDTTLDRWLAGPTRMAPGTTMGIVTPNTQDRADIIAYLRSPAAH